MDTPRETLTKALGRRGFLQAAAGVGAISAVAQAEPASASVRIPRRTLQPHTGPIDGQHYLPSRPDDVRWGYLPSTDSAPVLRMRSGETVTIDSVSHEGILEDQGRDPLRYFASKGVPRENVLDDAIDIAKHYDRHTRSFDVDGPHVVTGPIHIKGAEPGDVLKIEPLTLLPRVPYGVVSSRHGKGALPVLKTGEPAEGITRAEVMPPVERDGRKTEDPERYGNISVFTPVEMHQHRASGVMPAGSKKVKFPLNPFMGLMGVAFAEGMLKDPELNSIPPTLGGGNIDISLLGLGSAFYLPVFTGGALFHVGDPHMAMGDGEVALTAMEGSLRATFRLTVCKRGTKQAPSVAYHYPFAETGEAWVPLGLSDPDGVRGGQGSDLDVAMRRAVVNALDFLQHDLGMNRNVAYAYLSAAANFRVSQVVDRTVGVHGVISKSHFDG